MGLFYYNLRERKWYSQSCTKKIFRLNSSQMKGSSSSHFFLHWPGDRSSVSFLAFRVQTVSDVATLSWPRGASWTQILRNSFHSCGFPLSAENVAGYSKTVHQPYALVHTAFFLNSGRTLKDSRVAKGTRKQSALLHLVELHLQRSFRSKEHQDGTWLIFKIKNYQQALDNILMEENC